MQKIIWRSLLAFMALAGAVFAAESQVKIAGERVNLRAAPALNAEVVGQLNYGDLLTLKSSKGEWLEVVPPTNVDVWVYKDFINDGVVIAKKLQVRSGPGISFHVVGYLNRGDHVETRGDFSEWLKIAPPLGSSVWLNNKYAEVLNSNTAPTSLALASSAPQPVDESAIAQTMPAIAPAEEATTVANATTGALAEVVTVTENPVVAIEPTPTPEPLPSDFPEKWKMIPLAGQGKRIEVVGVVRRVGFFIGRPCPFQLKRYYPDGSSVTLCYIWANEEQLSSFLGQRISVGGREYWVEGSRYPVLVVERILPVDPASP